MEEVLLNGISAVAQAQNEVLVAEMRVILHDVPQNRPVTNGNHGLGDIISILPQAHSESAAKDNNFHLHYSLPSCEAGTSSNLQNTGQLPQPVLLPTNSGHIPFIIGPEP